MEIGTLYDCICHCSLSIKLIMYYQMFFFVFVYDAFWSTICAKTNSYCH